MTSESPAWKIYPARLIANSSRTLKAICEASERVVHAYVHIDGTLVRHVLSPSTLSKMCYGAAIQKPNGKKLTVLHLSIQVLIEGDKEIRPSVDAYNRATEFARTVTAAHGDRNFDPDNQRHLRTVDSLRQHHAASLIPADLIHRAYEKDDTAVTALAALLILADEIVLADYWFSLHVSGDEWRRTPITLQDASKIAYDLGRKAQAGGDTDGATFYYGWSIVGRNMDAAYQLGELADLSGNRDSAIQHFRRAHDFGHPAGLQRALML